MPAVASGSVTTVGSVLMAEVMIGIDPHKSRWWPGDAVTA